ncbi:MAG: ABC transporter substrate-binding protein, partial [Methanobacteriaceae archaeon]|nr:ABC transporter substrate-binding protein [Methanobacteriaceae archaeon]
MVDKKLITIIVIAIAIIGGLYYVTSSDGLNLAGGNRTITDMAGRSVEIPAHIDKVMGFDSANRELCYLNCSDKIVGLQTMEQKNAKSLPYMVANQNLVNLPVFGSLDDGSLNYEELAASKPDIIFVDGVEKAENIETKTGIPTVVVYEGMVGTDDQMQNYTNSLQLMGKIMDKEDRAKELTSYMKEMQDDLNKRTKDASSNQTVYIGGHAYFGAHGLSYTNAFYPPFNYLGLNNVASSINNSSDASHQAMEVGKEQLITWNPDKIFVESSSIISHQNDSVQNKEYSEMTAVKTDNVYEIFSYCMYFYNKEEMFSNSYYIGKVCYPDQFNDVDI